MKRLLTLWVAAGFLLSAAASAGAAPIKCADDMPCPDGLTCVEDICKLACESDADCDDGFQCDPYYGGPPTIEPMPAPDCSMDDPECGDEGDEMEESVESYCEPAPTPCESDADCADDEACVFGPTAAEGGSGAGIPGEGQSSDPSEGPGSEGSSGGGAPPAGESEGEDEGEEAPVPGEPEGICIPKSDLGWASECEVDEDCPMGMICEEIGSMGPSGVACACPADEPDCGCDEEMEEEPVTEGEVFYACVPAPCDTDADCGEGLVCLTQTFEMCEPVAVSPGAPDVPDCDPDDPECEPKEESGDEGGSPFEEPECETVTESYCVPPYVAPCEVSEDCGEGFDCVEQESCWCDDMDSSDSSDSSDGSEGMGDDASDTPMPSDESDEEGDNCGCEPTGEMMCELQDLPCTSDEDCTIEGWSCALAPSMIACTVDEETGEEVCEESSSEGQCTPEYWGWGGASPGMAEDLNSDEASSSGPTTDPTDESKEEEGDTTEEEVGAEGEEGEPSDAEGSGGDEPGASEEDESAGDGSNAEGTGTPETTEGTDTPETSEDEGGCQGGTSGSQGGLLSLMLMAMAVLTLRTRRERV